MEMRIFLFSCFILLFLSVISVYSGLPEYKNSKLTIDQRVFDLLSRMTLEEKVAQIIRYNNDIASLCELNDFSEKNADKALKNGIGTILFEIPLETETYVRFYNAAQKYLLEQTRLGIPAFTCGEALHGFMAKDATVFPQAIALSGTWDPVLVEKVFTAAALEMRSRGVIQAFTPVLDLARDPRWGRTEETYGEDPYLVSRMGVAAINGMQGRGETIDNEHVIATAKHFAVHGQPEDGTNCAPGNYSERVIREFFLYPFEMAVKEANVRIIMASYNEIDGVPSHGNHWLLTNILRGEWGFTGHVTADASGVSRLIELHKVADSDETAARMAIQAGVDIELPLNQQCYETLIDQVRNAKIEQTVIDSACARVLRNKFISGLFDNPYVDLNKIKYVTNNEAHKQLALEAARKSLILLKNEHSQLPLDVTKIKKLAVIGPNAAEPHFGGYSYEPRTGTSVLEGFNKLARNRFKILYAEGCKISVNRASFSDNENPVWNSIENDHQLIQKAVETAQQADAVIIVIGGNESTCREAWAEDHLGDRDDLDLIGRQNELVQAVLQTGKPVTVVLINGRPLTINQVAETVPSIIEAWYPGQEGGSAIAEAVFGEINPGGKLPITFPRSVGQLPVFYNHKPSTHDRSYINTPRTPLYPFGYGLSYTTFEISEPVLSSAIIKQGEKTHVTVSVKNTGHRSGDQVVQMYIRDDVSSITRPVKELKDFKRITLASGAVADVTFEITPEKLEFFGLDMKRIIEPGTFQIMVGSSSIDVQSVVLTVID